MPKKIILSSDIIVSIIQCNYSDVNKCSFLLSRQNGQKELLQQSSFSCFKNVVIRVVTRQNDQGSHWYSRSAIQHIDPLAQDWCKTQLCPCQIGITNNCLYQNKTQANKMETLYWLIRKQAHQSKRQEEIPLEFGPATSDETKGNHMELGNLLHGSPHYSLSTIPPFPSYGSPITWPFFGCLLHYTLFTSPLCSP